MAILRIMLSVMLGMWLISQATPIAFADPPATENSAPNPSLPAQAPIDRTTLTYTPGPYGSILLSVQLNGNTPAIFMLDSGVSDSEIDRGMAQKLGLTPQPALNDAGKPITLAGKSQQYVTTSLQIGPAAISSVQFIVAPENDGHMRSIVGQPIDGIIGANILEVLPCFIDFQKHEVTFFFKTPVTAEQRQSLGLQDIVGCPLTYHTDGSFYSITVHIINGSRSTDADLMMDTGSDVTILAEQSAKQLHLANIPQSSALTPFGSLTTQAGFLPSLSFPPTGLTIKNQTVSYGQQSITDGLTAGLGRDILSQFQVLFDFGAKEIYLKPIAAPAPVTATPLLSEPADPPIVPVDFNGKTIGNFLLATSQLFSSVTADLAGKLGMPLQPALLDDGKPLMVQGQAAKAILVPLVHVGHQTVTNFTCLVLASDNFTNGGHPVDGILGMDVLADHACLLDLAKAQIMLWGSGAFQPADLKTVDMADAVAVPLTPDGKIPEYSASANFVAGKISKTEKLLLDTAFPSSYMSGDIVAQLGLSPAGKALQLTGAGMSYTIERTIVPEVTLGPLVVKDFHTTYASGVDPPGVLHHLGANFFSQNRVLFDFAHKVMYVKPNPQSTPAAGAHP